MYGIQLELVISAGGIVIELAYLVLFSIYASTPSPSLTSALKSVANYCPRVILTMCCFECLSKS